jgi:hypothetical protein
VDGRSKILSIFMHLCDTRLCTYHINQ